MIRIGIVGPSRRRNGTGPYVSRFLHSEGGVVCAVCASNHESASTAAAALGAEFSTEIKAFDTLDKMVEECDLDAVAICSPAELHERQIHVALSAGLHVFCEKPLILADYRDIASRVGNVIDGFQSRSLVLAQNTQWTYILEDCASIIGRQRMLQTHFLEMCMSPPTPGQRMFWEGAPHPVSMLVALGASGVVAEVEASFDDREHELIINFVAHRNTAEPLAVRICLDVEAKQPRPASIVFDSCKVSREVVSLSPYRLALRHGTLLRHIEDPLRKSVRRFVRSIQDNECFDQGDCILAQYRILAELWRVLSTKPTANKL